MSKSSPDLSSNNPEFAVRRKTFNHFFSSPLPTSTFHDLVNKGRIIPIEGIRGFYRLNESLRRMGLREVSKLPVDAYSPSLEDIVRLAFHEIDNEIFPAPTWLLHVDEVNVDVDLFLELIDRHSEQVESFDNILAKLAYFQIQLDQASLQERIES